MSDSANPGTGWSAQTLRQGRCRPLAAAARLDGPVLESALAVLPHWRIEGNALVRRLSFTDFHRTMAFVNAVAWIAHDQDHHPDLELGYGACRLRFRTHSAGGITENDLICAARVDALLE